ncbi:MAG: calcium/sodium antiporter [Bacteroidales bacterium]|nr:calcium/sodium antiporter [Bacteroidales bacterium]
MIYLLFIIGFVLLIKGADWLVKGSSSLARRYRISELVIGLTIVSLGTSLPEMIINVFASATGNAPIAIGNVLGSNIANVLLILGLSAIFQPLPIKRSTVFSEIPFALAAAVLLGFLANAALFDVKQTLLISRADGGILMFFFILFMAYVFAMSREKEEPGLEGEEPLLAVRKSVLLISAGVVMLFFGGKWVVDGAVHLATLIGLSESFVGLTIVAIGTSLPELVTSIVAAMKKNADIAVGNVVGSNIFNILWVLGLSALIKPLPFNLISNLDILVTVLSSTLIIIAIVINRKSHIGRYSGVFFVMCYVAYLLYLVYRG